LCFNILQYMNNFNEVTYDVSFGDGSPTQNFTQADLQALNDAVCHEYSTSSCPGAYTFTITAISNCPTPTVFTISPIQIFTEPTAQFTNPASYCVNSAVPFTNTSIPGYNQGCNPNTVVRVVTQTRFILGTLEILLPESTIPARLRTQHTPTAHPVLIP